jgi:hypothetical protein
MSEPLRDPSSNQDAAAAPPESSAERARSRRTFLSLGAAGLAVGVLEACTGEQPPIEDGQAGTGGAASGGAGAGASGGGAGGTGGSGGTGAGTGGASGTGGTSAGQGGTTAGAGSGGTSGGPAGASSAGAGQAGASGAGAGSGAGGTSGSSGTSGAGMGGAGGTGTPPGTGGKENNGAGCMIGAPPTFAQAANNTNLPDPFKFLNGMRITRKDEWNCLRAELSAVAQACIYGPKMPPPDTLEATFSGGRLTINMTVGGQSGSFSVTISGAGTANNPVPCLITCGGSSLPSLSGVAKIDMPNNTISQESKNVASGGLVHTLYGNSASKSGSLIGWAWGLSRIIDALEKVPEAGIDVKRIAVTGCSRNGKGALAMGAFDERVALTIPQEGGSGGPSVWRVADAEYKLGQNIQEAGEIIGEANWQGTDFRQYAQNRANVNKLPADQHTVIALCAPRAVLVVDNDIDWLGPVACYAGGAAARKLYEGLGIADRIGVSIAANHGHCAYPQSQQAYLTAFVNRFLKGMAVDTSGVDDLNTTANTSKLGTFDEAMWIDWTVPMLSGNLAWDPFV